MFNSSATLPFKLFHSGKHWPRWCGAGGPSALMVLLCLWCVAGIGARGHQERDREREKYILRPPNSSACACVCAYIRVHATGGVLATGLTCVGRLSEQPHWRWPKQGAAVAKQGGLGERSGLCKVCRPKRWPAECGPISTNHVALFGLSCTRFYPAPCFGHIATMYTLFWPPPKIK